MDLRRNNFDLLRLVFAASQASPLRSHSCHGIWWKGLFLGGARTTASRRAQLHERRSAAEQETHDAREVMPGQARVAPAPAGGTRDGFRPRVEKQPPAQAAQAAGEVTLLVG